MRLADELVPVAGVGRQEPLVGEQHGDAGRVEVVLDRDQRLLEVAQEAADVADDEDVEGAVLRGRDHRLPGRGPPGRRPARRRDRPLEPGVERGRNARSRGPAARAGRRARSCRTAPRCFHGPIGHTVAHGGPRVDRAVMATPRRTYPLLSDSMTTIVRRASAFRCARRSTARRNGERESVR